MMTFCISRQLAFLRWDLVEDLGGREFIMNMGKMEISFGHFKTWPRNSLTLLLSRYGVHIASH